MADLFNDQPSGAYWYKNGFNPKAISALAPAVVIGLVFTLVPQLQHVAPFNWFIGAILGASFYYFLARPSRALMTQTATKTLGK